MHGLVNSGIKRLLYLIPFLALFNSGCKEEDSPDPGKFEYALNNVSQMTVGFKIYSVPSQNTTIVADSALINPGVQLTILKSITDQDPKLIIEKIEIWSSDFDVMYKNIVLNEYEKTETQYTWNITMPNKKASDIIAFNRGVHFYLNEKSLQGFYPKEDYPRTTYFFNTSDYFENTTKVQTPTGGANADFTFLDIFGSTIIGYDASVYSGKTAFIKSTDGGATWNKFLEFGFDTSDDAFVATDFIDEHTGWLFNYTTVFHGEYAQTYTTDIYKYNAGGPIKISTIDKFSVTVCKFIDDKVGYVLASGSNNVIPSDVQETYFLRTQDGGLNWSTPLLISQSHGASKLFKLNSGKIIVLLTHQQTLSNEYLVSDDNGQTWRSEGIPVNEGIRDLHFLENGTGYLKTGTTFGWSSPNIGTVYKTTDGGSTWTKGREQINGSTIWFYDENNGYLQDLIYGKGQVLYVTKNGGHSWAEVLYPYDYLLK